MEPIIIKIELKGNEEKMKYGVGVDVSKGKSTIAIMSVEGEIIEEPFEIIHDIDGFTILEEKLKKLPKEELKIVMKKTGNYHLPILGYLLDKEYFFVKNYTLFTTFDKFCNKK